MGTDILKYRERELKLYSTESNGDIYGIFFNEDYKFLKPNNYTVIDIGANIGDSAIYFALNGAKSVIAFEPFPYSYNYALRNINENQLNKNIFLVNAGYGKDSEIIIDDRTVSGVGSALVTSKTEKKIKVFSLKTIINYYNLNSNLLLKIGCEGCEYNLLNEDVTTLQKFTRIQI